MQNNTTVETYLPLVHKYAKYIYSKMPRYAIVELGDLINTGVLGLIEALEKFDLTKQVKLETYASHRILGSMQSSLRDLQFTKRSKMSKFQFVPIDEKIISHGHVISHDHVTKIVSEKAKKVLLQTDVLNRQERLTLLLYYWEDLNYKTIGKVLKVKEARICQIKKAALQELKQATFGKYNGSNIS